VEAAVGGGDGERGLPTLIEEPTAGAGELGFTACEIAGEELAGGGVTGCLEGTGGGAMDWVVCERRGISYSISLIACWRPRGEATGYANWGGGV